MANGNGFAAGKRFHIVLVPGFGGFDGLGKIEYYAGVTRVFPMLFSQKRLPTPWRPA